MSRYHAYLQQAIKAVETYTGEIPLSAWLRSHFAAHKKMGANDRRTVGRLVYQYYRMGKLLSHLPIEERLLIGEFICNSEKTALLESLKPAWVPHLGLHIAQKWEFLHVDGWVDGYYDDGDLFSQQIKPVDFVSAQFVQPHLFLRIRPGFEQQVINKIQAAGFPIISNHDNTIALPNTAKVDEILSLNKEAVVQDANSQRCGDIIRQALPDLSGRVWDCCAASGGKSLMLWDLYGGLKSLTVSDVRPTILHNLKKRFGEAGIGPYRAMVQDLMLPASAASKNHYEYILADVPCSGSGTWSRTPEQCYFFSREKIERYIALQAGITTNILPHLKSGGYLIYITCSVFAAENENRVKHLIEQHGMIEAHQEYLDGTSLRADSMFIAILQKP